MKRVALMLAGLAILGLVLADTGAFALELNHHQVYRLKGGMNADDIMQIAYFNQYTKFAYDVELTGYV